ncbi:hypothetical protein MP228_011465 [Amoeboaphelidium protococcarum]|nr:hypothetical protein MP228_011465 [Amoeboaphelidium protococcarum]
MFKIPLFILITCLLILPAYADQCIDLSKSLCGKFGVNFSMPFIPMGGMNSVADFDNMLTQYVKSNNEKIDGQCGVAVNINRIDNGAQYACFVVAQTASKLALALNATGFSQCNSGATSLPLNQQVCRSSCVKFLQNTNGYLLASGCKNTAGLTKNSTEITELCQYYPENDGCYLISEGLQSNLLTSDSYTIKMSGIALTALAIIYSLL